MAIANNTRGCDTLFEVKHNTRVTSYAVYDVQHALDNIKFCSAIIVQARAMRRRLSIKP